MTADLQLERTILGGMLLSAASFTLGRAVKPGDFSLDSNRRIFARMLAMAETGVEPDESTLLSELMRTGELDAVGGAAYVLSLAEGIPRGSWTPGPHIKLLRKIAMRRRIISMAQVAQARAESGDDPEEILAEVVNAATDSQLEVAEVRPKWIAEYVLPTLDELREQRSRSGDVLGVPSGIPELDLVTTGFRDGELTYIGGWPGSGKTSFMLQVMHEAAIAGVTVGCISLEMRATQLVRRLLVKDSLHKPRKVRDPRLLNFSEYEQARNGVLRVGELPIMVTDQSGLSPGQISAQARMMYDMGARIIVVDFVQIIREEGKDRREAINRVSASLRDTCQALNIPFVVASQLSRGDKDANKRPRMQDLRESGNLEQDAHLVLLLFRPEDNMGNKTMEDEIIIAKQREGVTGHVDVTYQAEKLCFAGRHPEAVSQIA